MSWLFAMELNGQDPSRNFSYTIFLIFEAYFNLAVTIKRKEKSVKRNILINALAVNKMLKLL